jgi:hypothetical protein
MLPTPEQTPLPTTPIVRVGEGRGFLVAAGPRVGRLVITAAHCLPYLPPPHPASFPEERTYEKLLSALEEEPAIRAECLFVDPIVDVAVLCAPDDQVWRDESEAYETFVDARATLRLAPVTERTNAWLFSLAGQWQPCVVDVGNGGRALTVIDGHLEGGMSGSPILSHDQAVGVVSVSGEQGGEELEEQHGQPSLINVLPVWLLAELGVSIRQLPKVLAAQIQAWERYLVRPFEELQASHPPPAPSDD